jgi:hypothetical protein
VCIAIVSTVVMLLIRCAQPSTKLSFALIARRSFLAMYAVLALLIMLFFGLGRVTVMPMAPGVHEMPQFGCCSQAFVFPNVKAMELVQYFKERHVGYMDVLTEDFANENNELRYAITPSLVQHVGRNDYRPMNKWGIRMAVKIWSFAFEKFDWKALRREHEEVAMMKREGKPMAVEG